LSIYRRNSTGQHIDSADAQKPRTITLEDKSVLPAIEGGFSARHLLT